MCGMVREDINGYTDAMDSDRFTFSLKAIFKYCVHVWRVESKLWAGCSYWCMVRLFKESTHLTVGREEITAQKNYNIGDL